MDCRAVGWAVLVAHAAGTASAFCGISVCPGPRTHLTLPSAGLAAGTLGRRTLRLSGGACTMSMGTVDSHEAVRALAEEMKTAASSQVPFSDAELDKTIAAVQTLAGPASTLDWSALRKLIAEVAHVSHKDWPKTEAAAKDLHKIIGGPDDPEFRKIMERVLVDGNWPAAAASANARPSSVLPWVVLVTGVNGIRKTSSVYQQWFKQALKDALGEQYQGPLAELPDGADSFFRQLDYMLASLANKDFAELYNVADIDDYASLKDAIFQRYRKLAETLGVLLVKEAQKKGLNVMVETSGRDVAMFKYVDQFFPEDKYRKLVVHFTINDIAFAETSVDTRMNKEMADGRAALKTGDARAMIRANAGGPYGSAVLKGVQADSDKVWHAVRCCRTTCVEYRHARTSAAQCVCERQRERESMLFSCSCTHTMKIPQTTRTRSHMHIHAHTHTRAHQPTGCWY
jgi:hypothetical protein